ncbi:MAG: glycosyltransferase family 4 protein [Verrucomicrobiales bacterium]
MKVIQLLPELQSGGVERGTLELGKHLVAHGHQSLVISHGGRLVPQLEAEGSRHLALPVHRKSPLSLRLVPTLRRLFSEEKPDLIHLRSRVPAWLAYLAWRKMPAATRPRLVSTVHGFYSVNRYSEIMTRGERVIAVSHSVKDYILKNYPRCPADKITVIHRGVDPADSPPGYQPSPEWRAEWQKNHPELAGKFLILLPGRITRWKGHEDFLKIIADVKKSLPAAHGLVAGSPHPRKMAFYDELRQKTSAAGLDDSITYLGHRSDLREVMAASDLVLSLSTDPEAFGRVSLEALTLGKPVAAYAHGGVGEQLHALLPEGAVTSGDWQAIAKLIPSWADTPPRPAPNTDFTLEKMLSKTLSVYAELLGAAPPR